MSEGSTVVVGDLASTPEGRAAIEHAAAFVRERGGQVVLVGYVSRPRTDDEATHYSQDREDHVRDADAIASSLRDSGLAVTVAVPPGTLDPADSILAVAEEFKADLIVVGIRRRSRVGKLVLGSNAQDILLSAACPVLAVKPRAVL